MDIFSVASLKTLNNISDNSQTDKHQNYQQQRKVIEVFIY